LLSRLLSEKLSELSGDDNARFEENLVVVFKRVFAERQASFNRARQIQELIHMVAEEEAKERKSRHLAHQAIRRKV
jgi:hypothetical protein